MTDLKKLNGQLSTKSYIEGYSLSKADTDMFATMACAPDAIQFPHAFRWYIHVAALTGLGRFASGSAAPAAAAAAAPAAKGKKPAKKADDDDDDMDDLFGDDDDDEEYDAGAAAAARKKKAADLAAAKKAAAERLAKKEKKQRSLCNLEIKPWEASQDLNALHKKIKETVVRDGLKWSENCALQEIAFGIKKMVLTAVIGMELSMDAIIEEMTEDLFPDEIQSMTMTSMSLL